MKCKLLKPIEGLEVGQTYEVLSLVYPNTLMNKGAYIEVQTTEHGRSQAFEYKRESTFMNTWFIFQELPETIIQQIRELIEQYEADRPEQHDNAVHRYAVDKGLPFSNSNEMFAAYKQLVSEDAGNFVSAVKELLEGGQSQ